MARSPTEIQADLALTRREIEHQLDDLQRKLTSRSWVPLALVGAGLVGGLVLARLPVLGLVRMGTGVIRTTFAIAGVLTTVSRVLGSRHTRRAARERPAAGQAPTRLRRAS